MQNKNLLISFIMLWITGCHGLQQSKTDTSGSGFPQKELSAEQAENELTESVIRYINQNADASDKGTGKLHKRDIRPVIAATRDEIKRLRSAWSSTGAEHDIVARRVKQADEAIEEGVSFPPEGGQHNQWYQCDTCQRGLITIDPHHHQCPVCKTVYSGFPFDNVLYSRQHSRNMGRAEDAAWAWLITGDKKYAIFAGKVLIGYGERYLNYPMLHAAVNDKSVDVAAGKNDKYRTAGHISEQTLGEAMLMIPAATAYDLIYDSNVLSEENKIMIEERFLKAMAECINGYKAGKSNWQTWHNAALLYAGAVTGDGSMIKQAMLDDENGFLAQMKISVMPEGMWYENSWGYHYYTLTAMTYLAEGGRRLGFDLYGHPILKKMYLIGFDYIMSDGSLPRFGDAVQDSPIRPGTGQKAYAAYRDERLMASVPPEPTWDGILLGLKPVTKTMITAGKSKLIPGAGHAILSSNGPGKLTAAITFGPYGGFHGHFDKLSFVFFAFGKEMGVDPGRAASQAYRLPIHQEWYKATTGHNIVLVDGKSQKEAEGKCLSFSASDSFSAITAEAGPAFENVNHKRFLLLSPAYLLVIDELNSADGKEHTFDWIYHNKGMNVSCQLPAADLDPGSNPAGYKYLKDISAYKADQEGPIRLRIPNEKTDLYLEIKGKAGDILFTGTGPLSSVEDRVPVIIVRRNGENVRFITLMEPVASDGKPPVRDLKVSSEDQDLIKIMNDNGEDQISFDGGRLENYTISRFTGTEMKILLKP
jgi:rubrerythrin